jgi:hypothetical protein
MRNLSNRISTGNQNTDFVFSIFLPRDYYIRVQPLSQFGQRPELSQATGMALVRCILGKFLGVDCHCFLPLF